MKTSKLIRRHIIKLLHEAEQPISTREIALKTKRAWHSIQLNCLKLQLEGRVECLKIGNINAWIEKKD